MDLALHPLALLLRLSFGALALALAMLTAAALGVPAFAADLVAQGMPTPVSWPAVLVECVLAMAALFPRRPSLRRVAQGGTQAVATSQG